MVLAVVALWTAVLMDARGQQPTQPKQNKDILRYEGWLTPPKIIADAVLASRPDGKVTYNNICPDGQKFLLAKGDGMPTAERMGRPCAHLGEIALDHTAYRAHDLYVKSQAGYELFFYADKRKVAVETPAKTRVSNATWSPDGSQLAFYVHFLDSTHIFIANTTTGKSKQLTKTPVLATGVTTFQWTRDGKRIQTVLLPNDGLDKVDPYPVATGPKVRINEDRKSPSRTIRFLLETPEDMKLLEHLMTGQLAFVDVASGSVAKVGQPAMFQSVTMSPAGDGFRVTAMKTPFSYYVGAKSFGNHDALWNLEGKNVFTFSEKSLKDGTQGAGKGKGAKKGIDDEQDQPPPDQKKDEQQPVDPDAKRDLIWRPDGAGMSYLQLEPAKKDSKDARKDRVMLWLPPFGNNNHRLVYETTNRIASVQYSDDCQMLFLTMTVDNQQQTVAVDLKDGKKTYVLRKGNAVGQGGDEEVDSPFTPPMDDYYPDDDFFPNEQKKGGAKGGKGGNAVIGGLLTRSNRGSANVVRISSSGDVYFAGTDRTDGAVFARPHIDKVNIKTGKTTRIFKGVGDMMETIDAVNHDDITAVFTTRQRKTVAPNSFMNDLQTGKVFQLTNNIDHAPWFHDIKTERIQVTREDGIKFWVKITSSPKATKKMPAMFWIYPYEYTNQAAYDKKAGGKAGGGGGKAGGGDGKFSAPGPRSMSMLTLVGYVVVEPDVPIIGPAGKMNDNYVKDLKSTLKAAIDELAKREIIDPDRLACGGHSYGAFSTANAMVHTNFFKAGIAGDGCYNRTLTPMTFQSEKRLIWEAKDTYLNMSPLLHADKMSGALLMYHGMWDANVGTNPINADHMYNALRGLGKPAALYMYPYEGHGPAGKETNLDMWARWVAWLDTHVMNAPKKTK